MNIKDKYGDAEVNSVLSNYSGTDFDFMKNNKDYKSNNILFASEKNKNEYIEAKSTLAELGDMYLLEGEDGSKFELNIAPRTYSKGSVYNPYTIQRLIKSGKANALDAVYGSDNTLNKFARYAFFKRLGVKDLSTIESNKKTRKSFNSQISDMEAIDPSHANAPTYLKTIHDYYQYWKENPSNTNGGKSYHNNRSYNEYELFDAISASRAVDEKLRNSYKVRYSSNSSILNKLDGTPLDKEYAIARELLTPGFTAHDSKNGGITYLNNYTKKKSTSFGVSNGAPISREDAYYDAFLNGRTMNLSSGVQDYSSTEAPVNVLSNETRAETQSSNAKKLNPFLFGINLLGMGQVGLNFANAGKGSGLSKYKYYSGGASVQGQISFIKEIGEYAVKEANKRPNKWVLPSVCIAQAALESGWGSSSLMKNANAYFGIKATGWKGKVFNSKTHEVYNGVNTIITAGFRAYDSAADSVKDYYDLICGSSRYKGAVCNSNFLSAIRAIREGGYATSETYVKGVASVYRAHKDLLDSFDARVNGYKSNMRCKLSDLTDEKLVAIDRAIVNGSKTDTSRYVDTTASDPSLAIIEDESTATTSSTESTKKKGWMGQLLDGFTNAIKSRFGLYEAEAETANTNTSTINTVTYDNLH